MLAYNNYEKTCRRVHFFSFDYLAKGHDKFVEEDFIKEYQSYDSQDESEFWKSYIGYVVVRPLPKGIIGATVLKGYTNDPKRKYTATREYKINICGIEKSIQSMVYIEQDSMLGACATSSLFSAFHKASQMFQTHLPFPNKITLSAGISITEPNRMIPNRDGLDILQIAKAIDALGLVPEIRSPKFENHHKIKFNNNWLKAYLYSYSRMGIPIILGFKFDDQEKLHAITINGYRDLSETETEANRISFLKARGRNETLGEKVKSIFSSKKPEDGIVLKSYLLERFYAHDDQIGPFSRLGFDGDDKIFSAWWVGDNVDEKQSASLHAIILPLENIIRIHFELVLRKVADIDFWLKRKLSLGDDLICDLYLDYSNEYKKRVKSMPKFNFSTNPDALLKPLPKYIWVSEFYFKSQKIFDIVFDSAEINETFFASQIFFHNSSMQKVMADMLGRITNEKLKDELWPIDIFVLNFFRQGCGLNKLNVN